MLDNDTMTASSDTAENSDSPARRTRRRAASRPAGPPQTAESPSGSPASAETQPASDSAPAKKAAAKKSAKKAAAKASADDKKDSKKPAAKKAAAKKTTTKKTAGNKAISKKAASGSGEDATSADASGSATQSDASATAAVPLLFQAPDPTAAVPPKRSSRRSAKKADSDDQQTTPASADDQSATAKAGEDKADDEGVGTRRRRSRGGRNRRKSSGGDGDQTAASADSDKSGKDTSDQQDDKGSADGDEGGGSHRRRRRRRGGEEGSGGSDDSAGTTTRVRERRPKKDSSITSVEGSTRIEAKKQRRREGREAGRRRPPILSESEFLARRESVERVMAIRQRGETTQIAVLEDNVLVEHYVALASQNSIIGNVYVGRVQNVLPSMEAAFIDIGKGRNAVLYAGEVDWGLREDSNQARRIENALKPGQSVLVQVSKDPVGHKGARLTSQISLPGRYLVYVPGGGTSGISRKLPDTERNRLKNLLKDILPDEAGVIIRTAAEGATEEELTRDVTRLTARWEDIEKKSKNGQSPQLLYAEPDTTLKVVRDLFTEDFTKLVISGDDAWDMVDGYVQHVAPDLTERLERYEGEGDVFANFRIDEQIAKALERKVWLPSGGSLVIDRTEAMTVVDVNTGKFTGSGGNLEETVTKNNLEAAEEIVRQLRLRDIGGIIVVDFIDMVLENNRDLVLRRLVECLGRDRTRHQVAEVTSLGLVQMTRKRISTGLLEAFSHNCEHCQGRGVVIESDPIQPSKSDDQSGGGGSSSRGGSKRTSNRRRGGKKAAAGNEDKGDGDKGDKADSGSGDKGDKADSGSGDKGDKADSGSGDKGDKADSGSGDKGDKADSGSGDKADSKKSKADRSSNKDPESVEATG